MAKTKTEIFTLIGSELPDNTTGLITPAATKLVSADVTIPIESRVVINPTAGQTFAVQIMRDSSGSNYGGVYPQAATVTAWGTAPSALLVISRLEAA